MDSALYHSIGYPMLAITPGKLTIGMVAGLVVLVFLLAISAFVSGSEVAYFSLSPAQHKQLLDNKSRLGRMAVHLLNLPDRLLATILITNNFVNVGIVVLSSYITSSLFVFSTPEWVALLIQVVAITGLILFCSEIFPKIYSSRHALSVARITAPGLVFFGKLFWPISSFLIYSTSIVNKRLIKHASNLSINDLSDALELTEPSLHEEKKILKGIVKFGNIDVCDVMKSRMDVIATEITSNYSDLLKLINTSGFSRIPVYENTLDEVKGILYIKDLLPHLDKPADFNWQALIRLPYFVPESKKINDLLKEFQNNRIHMAIVVDEYGGSSGIVTMEDILEEIVGEITDESDHEHLPYEKLDDNTYLFEAKILLNDFYKVLGLDDRIFDGIRGDADSLAGIILELRGEIPRAKDALVYKNLMFTIESVDKRRIKSIKVEVRTPRKNTR